ncbi:hypothetical protein ACWCQW_10330 [Streptomyces mirabilis]
MSAREELTPKQRAMLAQQLGSALPAHNSLLLSLGESIRERRGMAPVLRRLLDAETEVDRLRDELAEVEAGRNPLLRCLIVKAARDRDLFVGWSNIAEGPTGLWTRAEALAYGFPRSRLDRADANGSSDLSCGDGHWDDTGFIAEQRGWLRRDRLADYAQLHLSGNKSAAFDLLEPFEGETEVRR